MHFLPRKSRTLPSWPDPQSSLGLALPKRGKHYVWLTKGPAKRAYIEFLRPEIDELFESLEPPQGVSFVIKPYMVGRDKDGLDANPRITFCCPVKAVCKEAMIALQESECLERPEMSGFGIGYSTLPLESAPNVGLRLLGLEAGPTSITIGDDTSIIIVDSNLPEPQIGGSLRFRHMTDEKRAAQAPETVNASRQATGGPIIRLGDGLYQLTVAHATQPDVPCSPQHDGDSDSYWFEEGDFEYDPDDASDHDSALSLASRSSRASLTRDEDGSSDVQYSPEGSSFCKTDNLNTAPSQPTSHSHVASGRGEHPSAPGTPAGDSHRDAAEEQEDVLTYQHAARRRAMPDDNSRFITEGDNCSVADAAQLLQFAIPSHDVWPLGMDFRSVSLEPVWKSFVCITNPSDRELSLDYLLLKLPSDRLQTTNRVSAHFLDKDLQVRKVADISDDDDDDKVEDAVPILVISSHGAIRGEISSDLTLTKFPGSHKISRVFTAHLSEKIRMGDSGSAVIDAKTGDFYGHVALGTIPGSMVYIVPAADIFADIHSRFGQHPKLCEPADHEEDLLEIELEQDELPIAKGPSASQIQTRDLPLSESSDIFKVKDKIPTTKKVDFDKDIGLRGILKPSPPHDHRPDNTHDTIDPTNKYDDSSAHSYHPKDEPISTSSPTPPDTETKTALSSIWRYISVILFLTIFCICLLVELVRSIFTILFGFVNEITQRLTGGYTPPVAGVAINNNNNNDNYARQRRRTRPSEFRKWAGKLFPDQKAALDKKVSPDEEPPESPYSVFDDVEGKEDILGPVRSTVSRPGR